MDPSALVGLSCFVSSRSGTVTHSPLAGTGLTASKRWFIALDQRAFTIENERRTAQVVGVHVRGLETWVQIEFAGAPSRSLLLHLRPGAGIHEAVKAIHATIQREAGGAAAR